MRDAWSVAVLAGLLGSGQVALSQGPKPSVDIRERQSHLEVHNSSNVPLIALIAGREPDGALRDFAIVKIGPSGDSTVPRLIAGARVELLEPLSSSVGLKRINNSCKSMAFDSAEYSKLAADASQLRVTASSQARDERFAAMDLAALKFENSMDYLSTIQSDPARVDRRLDLDARDPLSIANRDREDAFNNSVAQMMAAMDANRGITEVYLRQLQQEADLLKAAAEAVPAKKRAIATARVALRREVESGRGFLSTAVEALDANSAAQSVKILAAKARRACDSPAGVKEYVTIAASVSDTTRAVVGELSFDKGGTLVTVFRRLPEADGWAGMVYWPLEAASAEIKIRAPHGKQWTRIPGVLQSGRKSFDSSYADAVRSLIKIEKMYTEAKSRAEGRDENRTMRIP